MTICAYCEKEFHIKKAKRPSRFESAAGKPRKYCSEECRLQARTAQKQISELRRQQRLEEAEKKDIAKLREREGMRPLADSKIIDCLRCGRPFISVDTRHNRLCPLCHFKAKYHITADDYGLYRGPNSMEVKYDRAIQ